MPDCELLAVLAQETQAANHSTGFLGMGLAIHQTTALIISHCVCTL